MNLLNSSLLMRNWSSSALYPHAIKAWSVGCRIVSKLWWAVQCANSFRSSILGFDKSALGDFAADIRDPGRSPFSFSLVLSSPLVTRRSCFVITSSFKLHRLHMYSSRSTDMISIITSHVLTFISSQQSFGSFIWFFASFLWPGFPKLIPISPNRHSRSSERRKEGI